MTVGDGIVTQIPALIISTGTGIIVTRAGSDTFLGKEIASQLSAFPKTLLIISLGLFILLLLPGIPTLPVLIVLTLFSLATYFAYSSSNSVNSDDSDTVDSEESDDVYDLLTVDPIEMKIGKALTPLLEGDKSIFMDKIVSFRKQYAKDMGFVIPKVRIKDDNKIAINRYEIFVSDVLVANGEIFLDKYLAINSGNIKEKIDGDVIKDPTYGLESVWVDDDGSNKAKGYGYTLVDPSTVLITHVSEVLKKHISDLVTRSETEILVNRVRENEPGLVDELIPNVLSLSDVQKVLQNLIKESVSVLNLSSILEVLVDDGKTNKDITFLTERVRQKLSAKICQSFSKEGDLHVLTLEPAIEHKLAQSLAASNNTFILEPKYAEQLLIRLSTFVDKMTNSNVTPILVTAPELRKHIFNFTNKMIPQLSVLSVSEMSNVVNIKSFGVVSV